MNAIKNKKLRPDGWETMPVEEVMLDGVNVGPQMWIRMHTQDPEIVEEVDTMVLMAAHVHRNAGRGDWPGGFGLARQRNAWLTGGGSGPRQVPLVYCFTYLVIPPYNTDLSHEEQVSTVKANMDKSIAYRCFLLPDETGTEIIAVVPGVQID